MAGTKITNIHVRDRYKFIRKVGWGKKYYSLLLCISDNYSRFFPMDIPYTVSVTHNECYIEEISFKGSDYSLTFTYPRYRVGYVFDSIIEERVIFSNGLRNLAHKKIFHEFGFYVYTAYSGDEPKFEDVKFPYKPAFESLTIQFKHVHPYRNMYIYVKTCIEVWQEFSEIFKEGKNFGFADFISIVLEKFKIPIEELQELDISGILEFKNGKIYKATSYTGKHLITISKKAESFLSPMCNYSCTKISVQQTFISPECCLDSIDSGKNKGENFTVQNAEIEMDERNKLYASAKAQLETFRREIEFFESNCSKHENG